MLHHILYDGAHELQPIRYLIMLETSDSEAAWQADKMALALRITTRRLSPLVSVRLATGEAGSGSGKVFYLRLNLYFDILRVIFQY